ncbi:MAG TPA: hypothetical protein VEK36_02425, partial [Candidatus Paceibacterota bacterium]|nr:hypothetical protein [Candidatus Paceibacterota bacterium]
GEEGVDCGAVCGILCAPETKPLEITSTLILPAANGEYDFVAAVQNPNSVYGASDIGYEVIFYDASGNEAGRRQGLFYIVPGQTRFLVESIKSENIVSTSQLVFQPVSWQKIEGPKTAIDFPLRREQYRNIGTAPVYSEYEGVIYNHSNFNLDKVDVVVLLLDQQENIIGVNTTVVRTFLAGTERYFKVSWPFAVSGEVKHVRIIAATDILNNSNFLKTNGSQEEFQKF